MSSNAQSKYQQSRSQKGLSLVEMMIALGIGAVAIMAVTSLVNNTNSSINRAQMVGERDKLVKFYQSKVSDYKNLQDTVTSVPQVAACLTAGDGAQCTATGADQQIPIRFNYGRRGNSGFDFVPAEGKVYGPRGESSPNGPKAWRVRVYFYATCANNTPTCDQARSVQLRFQVRREPGSTVADFIGSVPPDQLFDTQKSSSTVSHFVSGLLGLKSDQNCPPNSYQVGISNSGVVICQCRESNTLVGPNGSCIAGKTVCNTNAATGSYEMMIGINSEGLPICAAVRKQCQSMSFEKERGTHECPNAGWLASITLGQCRAVPAGKKSTGERPITCDSNVGRCCWYEI